MFQVEYTLHVRRGEKWVLFRRGETLPFAPFVGLDVLDDAVGEFHLNYVAWHSGSQMFLCQAQYKRQADRSLTAALKKAGWTKDEDDGE